MVNAIVRWIQESKNAGELLKGASVLTVRQFLFQGERERLKPARFFGSQQKPVGTLSCLIVVIINAQQHNPVQLTDACIQRHRRWPETADG